MILYAADSSSGETQKPCPPGAYRLRGWGGVDTKDSQYKTYVSGFPGGAVVENLPANAGDTGSSPGVGRSHMPQSN